MKTFLSILLCLTFVLPARASYPAPMVVGPGSDVPGMVIDPTFTLSLAAGGPNTYGFVVNGNTYIDNGTIDWGGASGNVKLAFYTNSTTELFGIGLTSGGAVENFCDAATSDGFSWNFGNWQANSSTDQEMFLSQSTGLQLDLPETIEGTNTLNFASNNGAKINIYGTIFGLGLATGSGYGVDELFSNGNSDGVSFNSGGYQSNPLTNQYLFASPAKISTPAPLTAAGVTDSVSGNTLAKSAQVLSSGTFTLSGGTVTVADTNVTATTHILINEVGTTGTNAGIIGVTKITPGTSFVITSTNSSDANPGVYDIIK